MANVKQPLEKPFFRPALASCFVTLYPILHSLAPFDRRESNTLLSRIYHPLRFLTRFNSAFYLWNHLIRYISPIYAVPHLKRSQHACQNRHRCSLARPCPVCRRYAPRLPPQCCEHIRRPIRHQDRVQEQGSEQQG